MNPTPLSEDQARDLLRSAGDTIDVAPAGPLDTSLDPRRRWPVLAAAAAVVLVVGGVTLGIPGNSTRDQGTPPAPAQTADRGADATFRLGPDQVPSIFGHTEEGATALLEAQGLEVQVEADHTCAPSGYASRTEPPTGSLITRVDTVRLFVTEPPPAARCAISSARTAAAELLAHALGDAPAPATAPGVDLEPALERLRTWAEEIGRYSQGGEGNLLDFPTPELSANAAETSSCGERLDDEALEIAIKLRADTTVDFVQRCRVVYVYYRGELGDSPIERVQLPPQRGRSPTGPADVVGNSLAFATDRLEAQGYVVEAAGRADCQLLGLVTAQRPYPNEDVTPGTTVTVAYTEASGDCVDDPSEVALPGPSPAMGFLGFIEGTTSPEFAEQVAVYVNDRQVLTLDAADAADRDSLGAGHGVQRRVLPVQPARPGGRTAHPLPGASAQLSGQTLRVTHVPRRRARRRRGR